MLRIVVLIFSVLLASSAFAQKQNALTTDRSNTTLLVSIGCEGTNCAGLTIDNTAGGVGLTSSKYNPVVTDQPSGFSQAQRAICSNTGAKIWVTDVPSVTLSSGKGQFILDGGVFTIDGYTNISNFKAIRDAAVSSTIYCTYYRQP